MDKTEFMWMKIDRLDKRIVELEGRVSKLLASLQEYENSLEVLLIGKQLEAKIIQLQRESEDTKVSLRVLEDKILDINRRLDLILKVQ